MLLDPAAGLNSRHSQNYLRGKQFVDVTEVYQLHGSAGSGQWIENFDRTHLVLVSGNWQEQKT